MIKNFVFIFLLFFISGTSAQELPKAEQKSDTTYIHDQVLIDNYAWLKDKSRTDPDILQYLQQENEHTLNYMKPTQGLQQTLYNEFESRFNNSDTSVPTQIDSFLYYSRIDTENEYYVYYRRNIADTLEEGYLDQNELAAGEDFFYLSELALSPDHKLLAYTVDNTGFEDYTLFIKDLQNNEIIEIIEPPVENVVWANDNSTIFYSTSDITGRSNKVYRHKLNSKAKDELVFEEPDGAFYLWLYKSNSEKYIFLVSSSNTTSEVWYMERDLPGSKLKLIQEREADLEYYVYDRRDEFYILTNADDAYNFKVMKTTITEPGINNWQEFIPHRDSVYLELSVFDNFLVKVERYKGERSIILTDHQQSWSKKIAIPESPHMIYRGYNPDYHTSVYRYEFESLVTPFSIYEYDPDNETSQLLKRNEVYNYDRVKYNSDKIFALAADGSEIPITLIYRPDLLKDDGNSLLLNGYGAYGDSEDPYFSSTRISLLDRGVIYATAHVRGGGDLGYKWYEDGKMDKKKNTFTDFITCADFLVDEGYTSYDRMVIQGVSAGGMLVGAVLNMRPDICTAAVADVPFVDVINSMMDSTLSATILEYEEWGNPNIKEEFEYMYSYCPYQNVSKQDYPDILATGGFYDSRVNYWEPAKWIAKIRELKTDNNIQLLYTDMNSGHSGSSGISGYHQETAFRFAYILTALNIFE